MSAQIVAERLFRAQISGPSVSPLTGAVSQIDRLVARVDSAVLSVDVVLEPPIDDTPLHEHIRVEAVKEGLPENK
jgi:hypothetical protein